MHQGYLGQSGQNVANAPGAAVARRAAWHCHSAAASCAAAAGFINMRCPPPTCYAVCTACGLQRCLTQRRAQCTPRASCGAGQSRCWRCGASTCPSVASPSASPGRRWRQSGELTRSGALRSVQGTCLPDSRCTTCFGVLASLGASRRSIVFSNFPMARSTLPQGPEQVRQGAVPAGGVYLRWGPRGGAAQGCARPGARHGEPGGPGRCRRSARAVPPPACSAPPPGPDLVLLLAAAALTTAPRCPFHPCPCRAAQRSHSVPSPGSSSTSWLIAWTR